MTCFVVGGGAGAGAGGDGNVRVVGIVAAWVVDVEGQTVGRFVSCARARCRLGWVYVWFLLVFFNLVANLDKYLCAPMG